MVAGLIAGLPIAAAVSVSSGSKAVKDTVDVLCCKVGGDGDGLQSGRNGCPCVEADGRRDGGGMRSNVVAGVAIAVSVSSGSKEEKDTADELCCKAGGDGLQSGCDGCRCEEADGRRDGEARSNAVAVLPMIAVVAEGLRCASGKYTCSGPSTFTSSSGEVEKDRPELVACRSAWEEGKRSVSVGNGSVPEN